MDSLKLNCHCVMYIVSTTSVVNIEWNVYNLIDKMYTDIASGGLCTTYWGVEHCHKSKSGHSPTHGAGTTIQRI